MSILVAILLGAVQGLTEFLPISSSGHLVAVPFALGVEPPSLAFAVALHLGTLVGVIVALKPEIKIVLRTLTSWQTASETERLLIRLLVIGSVPAGVLGLAASALLGDNFDRPVPVGFLLLVTGFLLNSTENRIALAAEKEPDRVQVTTRDAWVMGGAQALAILPGISRSGSTIAAGMRLGLTRQAAARFSFLLSVPAIAGAALVQAPDALKEGLFTDELLPVLVGIAVSGITGWWAIKWFMGVVGRVGLKPFGRYCWAAGVVVLLLATAKA